MKSSSFAISLLLIAAVVLSPGGGLALADEALGTAFTYQGRLTDGGALANGSYDFEFKLFTAATGGSQVGSTVVKDDVTVTNGLFTVGLDFGSVFDGTALYLEIGVRPGASGDAYTALAPRQALTATPHALYATGGPFWSLTGNGGLVEGTHFLGTTDGATLTLRVNDVVGWRLAPSGGDTPDIIGGSGGNWVASGVVGATIGGGGSVSEPNRVSDYYGTVGGGRNNQAGDADVNLTNSYYATVGGGLGNLSSHKYATVGGGQANIASQESATVGGGYSNTASGYKATVGGGQVNTASGPYATVPGGTHANATLYGQMAYASGQFAEAGDAQTSLYVLRGTTISATQAALFLDGSDDRLTLTGERTIAFDILVVARSDGGASASYHIRGVIERVGDVTALVGGITTDVLGEDDPAWDVTAEADDTNDALVIKVTGAADTSIRWVATVRTAEVQY